MTLTDFIHRHRAYLTRCREPARKYIYEELSILIAAHNEVERLRRENHRLSIKAAQLQKLYYQEIENSSAITQSFHHSIHSLCQKSSNHKSTSSPNPSPQTDPSRLPHST